MIHRMKWLRHAPLLPDRLQRDLLEGPVTLENLFGTSLQELIEKSKKKDEVAETVCSFMASYPPARSSDGWRDCRAQRQEYRRSTPAAAATHSAPQPAPPFRERQPQCQPGSAQRPPRSRSQQSWGSSSSSSSRTSSNADNITKNDSLREVCVFLQRVFK